MRPLEQPPKDDVPSARLTQQRWLAWAAAQIQSSAALDRVSTQQLTATIQTILAQRPESGTAQAHQAALVIAMQSHDRLAQQLSHVAEALQSLAAIADPERADWAALRQRQLRAFSMNEERMLFRRMVPDARAGCAGEDFDSHCTNTVELF